MNILPSLTDSFTDIGDFCYTSKNNDDRYLNTQHFFNNSSAARLPRLLNKKKSLHNSRKKPDNWQTRSKGSEPDR